MQAADAFTSGTLGLPVFTLMETAGRAAADLIEAEFGGIAGRTVLVCCGKGNNGGDGLVVARVLHERGAKVRVVLLGEEDVLTEGSSLNLRLLRAIAETSERLAIQGFHDTILAQPTDADLMVDALLGIGLTTPLRPPVDKLVAWMNDQSVPTIALDVPTGLHSDTGAKLDEAIKASLTVTMAAPKLGLLLGHGPASSGKLCIAEIGIPRFVLERSVHEHGGAWQATPQTIRSWLPQRGPDAHKYNVGMALVVAGSKAYTGAPVMSGMSAARAGSGMVVVAAPESACEVLRNKLTEVVVQPLPETETGTLTPDAFAALEKPMHKAKALLVGPGLGQYDAIQHFIRTLLRRTDLPAVIDADGLNALVGHTDLLSDKAQGRWVLTPHEGEFKRLAGEDADLSDRVAVARAYARRWNAVLLLKGMPSIVAEPSGEVWINATGGPALATAGTGDVLSGVIVGLIAQGMSPLHAAVAGLYLSGAAADQYAKHHSPHSMIATDLLTYLPHAFASIH